MKFLITKELVRSTLLTKLILVVSVALLFYLVLDVVLHGYVIGFNLQGIINTLYGNEEEFIEPIIIDSLLLQVHINLFMSLFSMLIIASIYIRLFSEKKMTKLLVHLLFILGLLAPVALMIAYFTSVWVAYVWIVSFMASHLLSMLMLLLIIKKLLFK